jgi:hypothetical protein
VFDLLVQLVIGPVLVAAATVASWRWGAGVGGLVSAMPAIVGPVLLIAAHRHGAAFAASTASGTLLGIAALSGFALVYAWTARRFAWQVSLAAGWLAAAAIGAIAGSVEAGLPSALAIAVASLALARRCLPEAEPAAAPQASPTELPLRMGLTASLILVLATAGERLGPTPGGVLAALPVLASILATFAHVRDGGAAATELLRGMLTGMAGFVVFCAIVAALVVHESIAVTFALAAGGAAAVHGLVLSTTRRAPAIVAAIRG